MAVGKRIVISSTTTLAIMLACFLALAFTTVAAAASRHEDMNALEAWNQHFPTIPFPQPLLSLLSPLTPPQIHRFLAYAKDGTLLTNPSAATYFCREAKAWCEDPHASIHHPTSLVFTGSHADSEHHDHNKPIASDPDPLFWAFYADAKPKTDATIVFHERDLLPGTKMMLNLHTHYPFRPFLPRSVADALPFSSAELSKIAQSFNIPLNSHQMLTTMQRTLRHCESPPSINIGEVKTCATSLEAMLDFAHSLLGSSHLKMMKTNVTFREASKPAEMLTLVDVPSYRPPAKAMSVVICHEGLYPHLVYYCHQIRDTKVFEVKLQARDGKIMNAVVSCHVNTTNWNPNNFAFQLLKTSPGPHTDICHFLSSSSLAWVSTKDSTFLS